MQRLVMREGEFIFNGDGNAALSKTGRLCTVHRVMLLCLQLHLQKAAIASQCAFILGREQWYTMVYPTSIRCR